MDKDFILTIRNRLNLKMNFLTYCPAKQTFCWHFPWLQHVKGAGILIVICRPDIWCQISLHVWLPGGHMVLLPPTQKSRIRSLPSPQCTTDWWMLWVYTTKGIWKKKKEWLEKTIPIQVRLDITQEVGDYGPNTAIHEIQWLWDRKIIKCIFL